MFLDISKAFDKVWPSGILFKLKQIVISEDLLELKIPEFLKDRKQGVVLNGKVLNLADITTRVPYGSDLGSFVLVIYLNDLANGISSTTKPFVEDTFLFFCYA